MSNTPDPTDKLADGQFQPAHRDGYGDHLASALDRAARGYALSTSEAQALAREVERLRGQMVLRARTLEKVAEENSPEVREVLTRFGLAAWEQSRPSVMMAREIVALQLRVKTLQHEAQLMRASDGRVIGVQFSVSGSDHA